MQEQILILKLMLMFWNKIETPKVEKNIEFNQTTQNMQKN